MSFIEIRTQQAGRELEEKLKPLYGKDAARAINRAINRTLSQANTEANRQIRSVYNIALSDLNNRENKLIKNSSESTLTGTINASIAPLSLSKFNPVFIQGNSIFKTAGGRRKGGIAQSRQFGPLTAKQQDKLNSQSGVTVEIIKGKKERIGSAFMIFKEGAKGAPVMARGQYETDGFKFGKKRLPINKLNTKSVFYAVFNENVEKAIGNKINEVYPERLTHELEQGLNFGNK